MKVKLAPLALLLTVCTAPHAAQTARARPNILWITCEDTSPLLGSYGDTFAATPSPDALAKQGVRYTQAFAYTGVCARAGRV